MSPHLIVVCVINWYSCITFPNKKGCRHFAYLLTAHGILTTFSKQVLQLQESKISHGIWRQNWFWRIRLIKCHALCVEEPALESSTQFAFDVLGNELKSRLYSASFHLPHFLLHLVKVKVQRTVFLPDSKATHHPHIDDTLSGFHTDLTNLDYFPCLQQLLTTESSLRQQILDTNCDAELFYLPGEVGAHLIEKQGNLARRLIRL